MYLRLLKTKREKKQEGRRVFFLPFYIFGKMIVNMHAIKSTTKEMTIGRKEGWNYTDKRLGRLNNMQDKNE